MLSACEGLDDEHWGAAMSADKSGSRVTVIGAAVAGVSGRHGRRLMQKLANGRDVVLAVGVGEQAVVADAVKAGGQHVQREAAHELFGGQCHGFVASAPVFAVVLPAERDAAIVQGDEP